MREIKRLIVQIANLLDLIENKKNQPIISRIRGLLYEVLDEMNKL